MIGRVLYLERNPSMSTESQQLLQEFQTKLCEEAFSRLVELHSSLVFSAALRCVNGDHDLAKDVAQTVFIDLALNASSLDPNIFLPGWLHRHTFFTSTKQIRSEKRRKHYESEATEFHMNSKTINPEFKQLAPILDEEVNKLEEKDREVLIMRFFQDMKYGDIGKIVGSTEDSIRMRTKRALDKLGVLLENGVSKWLQPPWQPY